MRRIRTLKKSAVIAAVCMTMLCVSGCNKPTPEQVAERTKLLYDAIRSDDFSQAKACIKGGANVKKKDATFLLVAAKYASKDIVELLIKSGADVNAKSNYGNTALLNALEAGKTDIAKILIKAGADMCAKTNDGKTALMYMLLSKNADKNIAEQLIKAGMDVNAENLTNETALMFAIANGYEDIAKMLIKAGADVNAKDNIDQTVLMYAVMMESKAIVELLIRFGADVNAKVPYFGYTALYYATSGSSANKDIADILRAAGAKE